MANKRLDSIDAVIVKYQTSIALLAAIAIVVHLVLRFAFSVTIETAQLPLWLALLFGGLPLIVQLAYKLLRGEFGSDLLAGISIVTSVLLGEYLAGTIVVLMLSGGEALEAYAVRSASSVLDALARRMPGTAHRKTAEGLIDIPLAEISVGDELSVLPHEVCPVDGSVIEGHSSMDESFLTGEPYQVSKIPGSTVISGALNGETALVIRAEKLAVDSRYARIMSVMETSQQHRPRMRRMADRLGAFYTPIAILIGIAAWIAAGDATRFLGVMVVATPCPLLIAIPVAIIGSVSLAARRAIIIRDPVALEQADQCRTIVLDKTGTLTYGKPQLTEQFTAPGMDADLVLAKVAGLEQYSKHPLAVAIVQKSCQTGVPIQTVSEISERAGEGLSGLVSGDKVHVTSRNKLAAAGFPQLSELPPLSAGLECVVLINDKYAATFRFRDAPRTEGAKFVAHLAARHGINRVVLLSGDRNSEVEYLAELVGITEHYGEQTPEQKLEFVRAETAKVKTIFVGDGINDAPALMAATVGIAMGQNSDVTTEAADAVIMDSSLARVDEFMHICKRMRRIALQSAVGGMGLSVAGMILAAFGYLPPVAGAITQEIIDIIAVLNALRVAWPPKSLIDFDP